MSILETLGFVALLVSMLPFMMSYFMWYENNEIKRIIKELEEDIEWKKQCGH